ncbi:hypothetical protein N7519_010195 [Penicillium mononematosum]|uniref:uncharacterized protein n=1 Tax=Penicillium mononematosum TaxID=268346 RepID=UPI0025482B2E|nr:uncharacterized protein N7519_010195 [Penicillium mononematosum]KAJ6179734.1 hypothetical protein N7519_010195 [Penicillium mononematosum]
MSTKASKCSPISTSTSNFTVGAKSRTFTLDSFSVLAPKIYLRQSLPFPYLAVTVAVGGSSSVQMYTDIDYRGRCAQILEKYKWLSVVGRRRLRHPLPARGSLSTPADPASIANGNLTGSHAKWSLTWLVGYAHDFGQPTTKMLTVILAVSQMCEESNNLDSLD